VTEPDDSGQQDHGDAVPEPGVVQRLSDKLAGFQGQLEGDEAAFLSGIISVAADAISASGDGRGRTGLVSTDENADSAIMPQRAAHPQLTSAPGPVRLRVRRRSRRTPIR